MQFISGAVLLALFVSGIKSEAEPAAYKDVSSVAHDYIQAFHHGGGGGGQHHNVGVNGGAGVDGSPSAHSYSSSQIQDQSGPGGVVSQDQVSHGSAVPPHILGPIVAGSSVIPPPYVTSAKSDIGGVASALHFGGRAIGGSPLPPYYPYSYYGKTYASPYYSQYQPTPYHGVYQPQPQPQPQAFYPYQYSASPYSATGSGGAGGVAAYSATPYSSSPVTPYSAYPYGYPYIPQYYPAYPSAVFPSGAAAGSYYQSPAAAAEIQSSSKQ